MVVTFRYDARKYAYDTGSGAVFPLSAIGYRLLSLLTPPLPPLCPTSVRYELAKYDADDVAAAYAELYGKAKEGSLFAKETDTPRPPLTPDAALAAAAREALLNTAGNGAK